MLSLIRFITTVESTVCHSKREIPNTTYLFVFRSLPLLSVEDIPLRLIESLVVAVVVSSDTMLVFSGIEPLYFAESKRELAKPVITQQI